jgi:carbon-monoxide dehydrogenase large subunit
MELGDWKDFAKRAKVAKKHGLIRGIGLGSYVEVCGTMGEESANVRRAPTGDVTILIGTQSSGQGHQTAYAQLIAEQFGLRPDRVHIVQGDTDRIATGLGTGGSSSIPSGGVSVERATRKLGAQLREIAAEALEAGAGDLEISEGTIRIAGTDRAISFAELVQRKGIDPAKLAASEKFSSADGTYPNGTHLVEVEIDPETGKIALINYVIVDDFGVTLNPLLLAGQVHGGTVQGIGQALMEQAVYDASGQLVTGTFMDYALPRAEDSTAITFETHNVPCKTNPLGVKGAGEAGAIGSCPALINAIIDALWREYRIDHIDMPATAERVWMAIREHQRQHRL